MDEVTLSTSSIGNGRYRVTGLLGYGGMAVVYAAFDTMLKVRRAIKVLNAQYSKSPKVRQRFLAEAQTMAQLRHSNIITIYDIGMDDGAPFIVMELAQGGSLQACLDSIGPYNGPLAAKLIQGALRGLHMAHEAGVIHRDIKPHNILLTVEGVPKLTDFGVARVMDSDHSLTKTGAVMGTLAYMAPEQRMNAKSAGIEVDVYSTGASLYSMINGSHSFDLYSTEFHDRIFEGVDVELRKVIVRACQYEPSERYSSADEMADALEPISSQVNAEEWGEFLTHLADVRPQDTQALDDINNENSLETYELDYGVNDADVSLSPNTGSTIVEASRPDKVSYKKGLLKFFLVLLVSTAAAVALILIDTTPTLVDQETSSNENIVRPVDITEAEAPVEIVPVLDEGSVEALEGELEDHDLEVTIPEIAETEVLETAQNSLEGGQAIGEAVQGSQSVEVEVEPERLTLDIDEQGSDSGEPDNADVEDLIPLGARIYTVPPSKLSIDGEDVGSTPWVGELAAGEYSLIMTSREGQVQETDISVTGDGEYNLCWSFETEGPCLRSMRERNSRSRRRRGR